MLLVQLIDEGTLEAVFATRCTMCLDEGHRSYDRESIARANDGSIYKREYRRVYRELRADHPALCVMPEGGS